MPGAPTQPVFLQFLLKRGLLFCLVGLFIWGVKERQGE